MGKLIALEGIDGCGKTTQITLVKERLQEKGYSVYTFAFPTRHGPIAALIDDVLRGEVKIDNYALQLLFAADKYNVKSFLEDKLKEYDYVLLDRYMCSGMAYGLASQLDLFWCVTLDTLQEDFPKAFNILLNIPVNKAADRKSKTSIYDGNTDMLAQIKHVFECVIPRELHVNANQPIEKVTRDVLNLILAF